MEMENDTKKRSNIYKRGKNSLKEIINSAKEQSKEKRTVP